MATRSNTRAAALSTSADVSISAGLPAVICTVAKELENYRAGVDKIELAVSNLGRAIVAIWDKALIAIVGSGDHVEQVPFTVADMYQSRVGTNGKERGNDFRKAQYAALADALDVKPRKGEVDAFNGADKQAFVKGHRLAGLLKVCAVDVRWSEAGVNLPASEVFAVSEMKMVAEKDADGKPIDVEREVPTALGAVAVENIKAQMLDDGIELTDAEALNRAKLRRVTLGAKNATFGLRAPAASTFATGLKDRMVAAKQECPDNRAPRTTNGAKGEQGALDSVEFLIKTIKAVLDPNDDKALVPSPTLIDKLGSLYEVIGAFFAEECPDEDNDANDAE